MFTIYKFKLKKEEKMSKGKYLCTRLHLQSFLSCHTKKPLSLPKRKKSIGEFCKKTGKLTSVEKGQDKRQRGLGGRT